MKISQIYLKQILFLDIETVPLCAEYSELSEEMKTLWEQKSTYQRKGQSAEDFYPSAGIWAEFGKIVCISVGIFSGDGQTRTFRVKSFYGDEKSILEDFKSLLESHFDKSNHYLCAHNGKEFDFPYIARRMIIHGMNLPKALELLGKKPWEVAHLDTMELWRFGDHKAYTSLNLLTHILGIPSSKDDITGKEVASVFYNENNIERIVRYCEKDTINVAQIFLRLRNEPLLEDHSITLTT